MYTKHFKNFCGGHNGNKASVLASFPGVEDGKGTRLVSVCITSGKYMIRTDMQQTTPWKPWSYGMLSSVTYPHRE